MVLQIQKILILILRKKLRSPSLSQDTGGPLRWIHYGATTPTPPMESGRGMIKSQMKIKNKKKKSQMSAPLQQFVQSDHCWRRNSLPLRWCQAKSPMGVSITKQQKVMDAQGMKEVLEEAVTRDKTRQ